MSGATEAQARAIAEALGWESRQYGDHTQWAHSFHGGWRLITPRLTSETTLGRAMCYDAIVWLYSKQWAISYDAGGWLFIRSHPDAITGRYKALPAALEAAMIKELGL